MMSRSSWLVRNGIVRSGDVGGHDAGALCLSLAHRRRRSSEQVEEEQTHISCVKSGGTDGPDRRSAGSALRATTA